jgi:hypothetical protein
MVCHTPTGVICAKAAALVKESKTKNFLIIGISWGGLF